MNATIEQPTMRKPPDGDQQGDMFLPRLYDVATKDSRSIMDVAVFRLSKRDRRIGEVLHYDLGEGGYIEVTAGPHGMASIWDYDIVLMMISHLTDQFNRMVEGGREDMPDRIFRPHVGEILKFCRRSTGGKSYAQIEDALARLRSTEIKVVRRQRRGGKMMRVATGEGLIGPYKTVSFEASGRLAEVEIEVPNWIYDEVCSTAKPEVLTVSPDFFLIDLGIGRFVYRLARRAAGKNVAKWSFRTVYERSGSAGTLKEFTRSLRKLIAANDLPEYNLKEVKGREGPVLVMTARGYDDPDGGDDDQGAGNGGQEPKGAAPDTEPDESTAVEGELMPPEPKTENSQAALSQLRSMFD